MIIVEGPDGSGKTTLAKHLAEKFDLKYRRYPKDPVHGPDNGILDWWDKELRANELVVYDRCFYISELIYQLVSPERSLIASGARMMNGVRDLWDLEPFFVFCQTDWDREYSNLVASGRYANLSRATLQKISWAYDSVFAMWENALFENVRRYDFQISDHSVLEGLISSYIEKRRSGKSSPDSS